ncbi:dolichol-phosphate mannosyltransferase subunit 3 [Teleopsis dalmanni]|uniref:dolichol-phosphate mannosyltransferase subunit 3 n=1 Tax=Teleopsis dalmanni TaxID=139649 RepID=UPI0018CE4192|nr:dolichol-phosphate mannosyltransferase subunit 3 [Teleopsis dalmanni]
MTNLMRWLMYLGFFAVPYVAILTGTIKSQVFENFMFHIQILPLVLLFLFGLYSASTVLYRTLTFNDCPEAAKELQNHIKEAREDLIKKGFKFRN